MPILAAALLAINAACVLPPAEEEAQMALSYEAFDARGAPYGWRALNNAGCADPAITLLADFAATNDARLTGDQRRELAFHTGQVLALAGREAEAIPHFERADGPEASSEWRAYVAATLAFLHRDAVALATARETYARISPDSMRLRIIDGFLACPNDSYVKAAHCKM